MHNLSNCLDSIIFETCQLFQLMSAMQGISHKTMPKGLQNISSFKNSNNMTEFVLKKIRKTHGHFNKDYVLGFTAIEDMAGDEVREHYKNIY